MGWLRANMLKQSQQDGGFVGGSEFMSGKGIIPVLDGWAHTVPDNTGLHLRGCS